MAAFLNVCKFTPTLGGTTDWTYSAAVTGYQSPALAGVVNSRVYKYRAESADLSQWEMGEGAYNTGTGVLARTTVLYNSSGTGTATGQSGAGSKINFSTAPQVAIVALKEDLLAVEESNAFTATQKVQAQTNLGLREVLTAARTYYCRDADGSDSNTGLANTAGGAFLTLQKAIDVVTALDQSIYTVTIQLADGNYSAGGAFTISPSGPIVINGNSGTPANVVVDAATAIAVACVANITLQNFEAKGSANSISMSAGASVTLGAGMRLTGAGVSLNLNGLCNLTVGAVTVTFADNKTAWLLATGNALVVMASSTLSFSGTPAWSSYGIGFNTSAAVSLVSVTISGSATGYRYYGTSNAVLNSAGAGTASTYFPGGSNGILETGAQQL